MLGKIHHKKLGIPFNELMASIAAQGERWNLENKASDAVFRIRALLKKKHNIGGCE